MHENQVPDRRIGLVAGIIGGVLGTALLHVYLHEVEPRLLPDTSDVPFTTPEPSLGDAIQNHALDSLSVIGILHQPDESSAKAAARTLYTQLTSTTPAPEMVTTLADVVGWAAGIGAGAAYGGTRTTTESHDLAGGFFYGIRLWVADTFGLALIGLRPGPTALTPTDHLRQLIRIWIYSFAMTTVTRLLYIVIAR